MKARHRPSGVTLVNLQKMRRGCALSQANIPFSRNDQLRILRFGTFIWSRPTIGNLLGLPHDCELGVGYLPEQRSQLLSSAYWRSALCASWCEEERTEALSARSSFDRIVDAGVVALIVLGRTVTQFGLPRSEAWTFPRRRVDNRRFPTRPGGVPLEVRSRLARRTVRCSLAPSAIHNCLPVPYDRLREAPIPL